MRPGSRPARPDLSLSLTLRTHPQVIIQDAPTASNSDAPAATATGDGKPDVDEKPEVTQADAEDDDEEDEPKSKSKKRKAAPAAKGKGKATGAAKKGKKDDDKPRKVTINLQQAVTLTFSIKYLSNFAKSTPLSETVHLHMSNEVPLLVEYPFPAGHIRYYLAPKISVRPSPPPPSPRRSLIADSTRENRRTRSTLLFPLPTRCTPPIAPRQPGAAPPHRPGTPF